MNAVLKYALAAHGETVIQVPKSSQFLAVQVQKLGDNEQIAAWFLCDTTGAPDHAYERREFKLVMTGEECELPPSYRYRGTLQLRLGLFVVHAFEKVYDAH